MQMTVTRKGGPVIIMIRDCLRQLQVDVTLIGCGRSLVVEMLWWAGGRPVCPVIHTDSVVDSKLHVEQETAECHAMFT